MPSDAALRLGLNWKRLTVSLCLVQMFGVAIQPSRATWHDQQNKTLHRLLSLPIWARIRMEMVETRVARRLSLFVETHLGLVKNPGVVRIAGEGQPGRPKLEAANVQETCSVSLAGCSAQTKFHGLMAGLHVAHG